MTRLAALLLLTLGACTMSVGPAHPRPNVFLEEDARFLSLVLPGSIRDEFQVPSRSGLKPVDVRSWRKTLTAGFRNGFAGAFRLAHSPAASDLTIELLEADLEIVPRAWSHEGDPVAASAQIRYRARLVDASGAVLGHSARTVASKASSSDGADASRLAASAVESMYEAIAMDLFP